MSHVFARSVALLAFVAPLSAQCPLWRSLNSAPNLGGIPLTSAVFDDGTGPAYWLGGQLYTFAGRTTNGVLRHDGAHWQAVPIPGGPAILYSLRVLDLGAGPELYAAGYPGLWRWTSGGWIEVTSFPNGDGIVSLDAFDFGSGKECCAVITHGFSPATLERFHNGAWTPVSSAIGGWPTQVVAFDDGTGPSLYVAGIALTNGGLPAGALLEVDASSVTTPPQPSFPQISTLRVVDTGSGPRLHVGAVTPSLSSPITARVERLDGGAWTILGEDFTSTAPGLSIADLVAFDDGLHGRCLVACGTFSQIGVGVTRANVARFDAGAWQPIGGGLLLGSSSGPYAAALAVIENGAAADELVAAGTFTVAGGAPATNVASWTACDGAGSSFCAGDGADPQVLTTCPCANAGAPGHGCANSVNAGGALLDASGRPESDDVLLHAQGMPASAPCLFFKASGVVNSGFQAGDGILCLGGALVRLGLQSTASGNAFYPVPGQASVSQRGGNIVGSGQLAYYQAVYRNASTAFCPPETINVTNGCVIAW